MSARLASGLWVQALVRRVNHAGAFAAVLRRGEAEAGAILLCLVDREGNARVLARVTGDDGRTAWRKTFSAAQGEGERLGEYLAAQARYDPDLWVVELVGGESERFIAEPIHEG